MRLELEKDLKAFKLDLAIVTEKIRVSHEELDSINREVAEARGRLSELSNLNRVNVQDIKRRISELETELSGKRLFTESEGKILENSLIQLNKEIADKKLTLLSITKEVERADEKKEEIEKNISSLITQELKLMIVLAHKGLNEIEENMRETYKVRKSEEDTSIKVERMLELLNKSNLI